MADYKQIMTLLVQDTSYRQVQARAGARIERIASTTGDALFRLSQTMRAVVEANRPNRTDQMIF